MNVQILYRLGIDRDADRDELPILKKYFDVVHQRAQVKTNTCVLGRFSVLPYYLELERDLNFNNSFLINTYRQHQFIADMREWCAALGNLTPKLYERLQDLPDKGPFIVKGQTNSRKLQWDTHMYAPTKRDAISIYSKLKEDSLFADQEIYARDYIKLKSLMTGFNGLPIANEFRFFVLDNVIVSGGYYWSSHVDELDAMPDHDQVPRQFLAEAMSRIADRARFYTIDVAQMETGDWTVIEINDGQMSGISCNRPDLLYSKLSSMLK